MIAFGQYKSLFITYFRPHSLKIALLTFLILCGTAVQIGNPQILRYFLDTAAAHGALRDMLLSASLFLGGGLLTQVLSISKTYVGSDVAWKATNQLRADLVRHCLKLDMPFHNKHTPGELIERIDGDTLGLSNLLSLFIVQIGSDLLLLVGVLFVLFFSDWRLGLAVTLYALVCLAVLYRLRGVTVPAWVKTRQAIAHLHGFIGERFSGVVDLRTNGAIPATMRSFYALRRVQFFRERFAGVMSLVVGSSADVLFVLGSISAFILGANLFQAGAISIGTVYLIVNYTELLIAPLRRIIEQLGDFQTAAGSIQRIQELLNVQSAVRDGSGAHIQPGALAIDFENIYFGYSQGNNVISDITLHIESGEVLGVLGHTGSGKTTLARLLFRLYDPSSGQIRINGIDTKELKLSDLRQHIGMVTQEVQLFHATVRDNLTFFTPQISDKEIIQALQDVGLSRWYQSLPKGLDTELTAGGGGEAGLSAGEAQLLAFTRIFLRNPSIIVLDEASSRLDPATEQYIERAVDKLLLNRTSIIIAHRLSTITRADTIVIIEHGKICEYGKREQLMQDTTSRFSQLLQTGIEEVLA